MNKFAPLFKNWTDSVFRYSAKLKEFFPAEKETSSVGLDIGTSSVKLIQLQKSGREFKVTRFGIEPIKNNNREDATKKVLVASNVMTKEVNIAVSGQGVILRYIQMPKMSVEELRQSIILEADKYIPFPLEEVITDCYIIKELPPENKILALVAAAKKDLIEQRVLLLEKLGLVPAIISLDSVVLANVFNVFCQSAVPQKEPTAGSCQTVGVLNVGGAFSSLTILDKGLPLFTRDIFIGGEDITKRMANQLGIDRESAEKMKTAPDTDGQKIVAACETILSNLITEIRFSFDYFETENNLPISFLYITGGGAYMNGIDNYLQQSLGIEVKAWDPFATLQISPEVSSEALKKQRNKLGIALGLALYQND